MSKPPESTRHNNLTKLLILLSLRANSKIRFNMRHPVFWNIDDFINSFWFNLTFRKSRLLVHAMIADHLNWCLCFMSAWMVGKVLAPAKANIIVEKALIIPIQLGSGYSTALFIPAKAPSVIFLWSIKAWITTQTQAITVVNKAPTAIGLKTKKKEC